MDAQGADDGAGKMDANQASTIRVKVAAREVAKEWLACADSEIVIMPLIGQEAFFDELISLSHVALEKIRPPAVSGPVINGDIQQPMDDVAATSFGQHVMAYPPFEGKKIDEVPLRDLIRISEVRDTPFKKQLRRYLASPSIKALIEREGL